MPKESAYHELSSASNSCRSFLSSTGHDNNSGSQMSSESDNVAHLTLRQGKLSRTIIGIGKCDSPSGANRKSSDFSNVNSTLLKRKRLENWSSNLYSFPSGPGFPADRFPDVVFKIFFNFTQNSFCSLSRSQNMVKNMTYSQNYLQFVFVEHPFPSQEEV